MPINVTVSWIIITKIMYFSDEQHTNNHKFTFLCGAKPVFPWVETYVLMG